MTVVDRAIARAPLARHGEPAEIAKLLRRIAVTLEQDGARAEELVQLLSARGWSAGTMGDGGSRSTDDTSSVERTIVAGPGRWAGKDRRYHRLLQALERTAQSFVGLHGDVLAHGTDDDPVPTGTGSCLACARECKPTEGKPGNRLVSGLCPTCYRAWRRYTIGKGELIRPDWISRRRESYTERGPDGAVVRIHTPEPDHDIDLSVALATP